MTEELNRRHNLATMPTINNNGESYIVPFDIYKEGYDAYDISNWFKGRVGDNGTPFGIRWYKHGQLMDVTGMRPFIEGQVGDYTIDDSDPDDPKINMDSEASNVHVVGDVNDCQEYGVAIYRLISQAMPQSGIFYGKIGVMGTQDDGTTVMSSVDVVFKVLAGHMNMMGARKFYVSELEKAWLDLQARIKQYNQEYKDATAKQAEQFKEDTKKALADLNTKIANEIKRAEDTLGDTQAAIDANIASLKRIATTAESILIQIKTNDIVKLSDFKDQTNALANGQKNLTSTITSKLATLSAQPELFNSLNDIKAKYPNGSIGVKIATDTWHGWGYINDSWKDLGDYKPTSVPPIQLANASTAYLDEGNQISFRKLNDGNTAFKLPKGLNIIGHYVAVKLDDIKAAAVSSSNVKYEDGEFVGNTFLCIYHPSTKTVSFESSYANTNPEDLILFGVMWNSWIGGVLIQDSYNNRVENSARPWYGYLYGRDPLLEFSEVLGKSVTLSLDFNITIYGNQNHVDLTKEKITSDITEQLKTAPVEGITYDEKTYKLTSDEFSLIYDFADQKVKVIHKALPTLASTQVNLFSDYFGNGSIQGIAYEDYFKRSVENSARQWHGYLYGRTPLLDFSEVLGKSTTLSLDFNITIYGNQNYIDLTKEKITSDIKEQLKTAPVEGITYDEKDFKLSSDEFSLIYDFADQKVKVFHKAFLDLTSMQVNLFSDYFGSGSIQGIAYEDYLKRSVDNSARPWYGYLYGRTPLLEFSEELGKSSTLSLDFNITIYGNQNHVDLTKEKITSDITEQLKTAPVEGITYDEKTYKLTSDEFSLIYDFADQKVKVDHSGLPTLTSQQVNIFSQYFGNDFAGIAYEDYFKQTVKNSARPWYGYLYGRDPLLEFSEDSGKSVTLSLDFNITIYGNQKYVDLTKEKITSDITEQLKTAPVEGITYDEKDFKLSSDEFTLIYDFSDQKVKVFHKAFLSLTSTQVNLFSDYFGNGSIQGIAYEDYLKRKRTMPEYWQTELNQKIAEIQENVSQTKDGLSFLWITDIHWESNDGLSPMLIKQLLSRTNISYMIDGGDHFNAGSTIKEAINKLSEGYSNLTIPGIDHISVVGNHDDNKMLWDSAKVLQNYQIFNAMFPHTLHSVDLKMTNYPVDLSWELKFNQNPELINHKYQYAAFGFDGRLEASKDQILKFVEFCKNPYKILAFTHGILDYGNWLQWGTDLGKIIDAINNKDTNVSTKSYGVIDLKGVQAKVIALISGHEHQDNVKYTAGGTPLIVTDSDCGIQTYKNTKYPYKKGTITEQSFSVFSIDLDNSKIYEVKVGRGEDREFNIPEICKDDPQPTQPASGTEHAKSEPAKQDETKPATSQMQSEKQETGETSSKPAETQAQPTETKKDSDKQ